MLLLDREQRLVEEACDEFVKNNFKYQRNQLGANDEAYAISKCGPLLSFLLEATWLAARSAERSAPSEPGTSGFTIFILIRGCYFHIFHSVMAF